MWARLSRMAVALVGFLKLITLETHLKRLYLLPKAEIDNLYARPTFNTDEQEIYFTMNQEELNALAQYTNTKTRVFFVLQLGYFKAKYQFFNFTFQACRYLVINSGTSQSPEFTRQRDRYAYGALAALRPFIFKSPTGLKNNTTTMADAFSVALYFSCGKTSGLRLPGTTRLGVPPSLARSGRGSL